MILLRFGMGRPLGDCCPPRSCPLGPVRQTPPAPSPVTSGEGWGEGAFRWCSRGVLDLPRKCTLTPPSPGVPGEGGRSSTGFSHRALSESPSGSASSSLGSDRDEEPLGHENWSSPRPESL